MKFSLKEFFLKEYEDPTSSKHAQDDSKWAGPNSDKERMPHELPQNDSQENSSDAWEETRENGPKSSSQKSSGGGKKLKDFFGGNPYPKSSHEGTGKSSHSSRKMSEAKYGSGYPDEYDLTAQGPVKRGSDEDPQNVEIPMGDMDDFGFIGGQEDYDDTTGLFDEPWPGVNPERGTNPKDLPIHQQLAFNDDEPMNTRESKMSEGGKGSGRKKGSKNKPRDEWGNKIDEPKKSQAVAPDEIPDELPDEWVADEPEEKEKSKPMVTGGEDPTGGHGEDEIDWSSLDDDDFIDQLAGSDKGPEIKTQAAPPKMKDTISTKPADQSPYKTFDPSKFDLSLSSDKPQKDPFSADNENIQTWDEVRATAPQQAAELEKDFPPQELKGAKFSKKHDGRIFMMTTSGQRYAYLGHKLGWSDMDDGNSPSGEF